MKKKLLYESPDAEVIELRLEQGVIMASGDGTQTPVDEGDEDF